MYLFFSSCCVGSLGYLEGGVCLGKPLPPHNYLYRCSLYSGVNCSNDNDMQGMITYQNNIIQQQQNIIAANYGAQATLNAQNNIKNAQTNITNINTCRTNLQTQIATYDPNANPCDDDHFVVFNGPFTTNTTALTNHMQNATTTWGNMCTKIANWNTGCSGKITSSQLSNDTTLKDSNGNPLNTTICIGYVTDAGSLNKNFLDGLKNMPEVAALKAAIPTINNCLGKTGASTGWTTANTSVTNTVQPRLNSYDKWVAQNMGLGTPFYGGPNTFCSDKIL